jgi:multicomponent Na+:H+ antiporter subunit B
MNRKGRLTLFLGSAIPLAAVLAYAFAGLPPTGDYRGPYGDLVNAVTVPERNVTDTVTAVNFDIRGFDTLGEEFILFVSVMGVLLLLRRQENEPSQRHEDRDKARQAVPISDAVRVMALLLLPAVVLFGIYVVTHGQMTPGGGFQGGVVLATAPLLLYLAGEFGNFRKAAPRALAHITEAVGAGGYAAIGLACLGAGAAFLQNVLPLGSKGTILSGGTIPLINASVGLEVAGGLVLVLIAYLEETLELEEE